MVKKIPTIKEIVSRHAKKPKIKSFSLNSYSLNRQIPPIIRKIIALNKKAKIRQNRLLAQEKRLLKSSIRLRKKFARNEMLRKSEAVVNLINSGIGFSGTDTEILKDALNLKPTTSKRQYERLKKIADQIANETFNLNQRLKNNTTYKNFKEDFLIRQKGNTIRIIKKTPELTEIENQIKAEQLRIKKINARRKELGWKPIHFREMEYNKLNDLKKQLDTKIWTDESISEKSLREAFKFIFKDQKEREFYEEMKEFFILTGGGTKANRSNPEWVKVVRQAKSDFNSNYYNKRHKAVFGEEFR